MSQNNVTRIAWIAIIAIAYATLTHAGFIYAIYFKPAPLLMWPEMRTYAHFEHVIAFALLGVPLHFAYPKRLLQVCCIALGRAAILEIAPTLTPDRHGTSVGWTSGPAEPPSSPERSRRFCLAKQATSD